MKEKLKAILNKAMSVMSIVLLLFAAGLLVYVLISKLTNKTPQVFGYSFHFVVTNSMEPDIMTGDFVVGKKISLEKLYEDNKDKAEADKDVILFVSPNPADGEKIIVHKIRSIVEDGDGYKIYTYGVNNPRDDIYPTTEVIGKVVAVSGLFGKIFNPMGIIFLLLIFGMLIIFYMAAKSLIKNYRNQQETIETETKEETKNTETIEAAEITKETKSTEA